MHFLRIRNIRNKIRNLTILQTLNVSRSFSSREVAGELQQVQALTWRWEGPGWHLRSPDFPEPLCFPVT